jgi:phage shock protein A
MDKVKIKSLSKQAKELSSQAVSLIEKGEYIEGHKLMRQAVEAGRQCRQLIEQPKIERGLAVFEQMHQS